MPIQLINQQYDTNPRLYSFKLFKPNGELIFDLHLSNPLNLNQKIRSSHIFGYSYMENIGQRIEIEPIVLQLSIQDFYKDTPEGETEILIEFKSLPDKYHFLEKDEKEYIHENIHSLINSPHKLSAQYEVLIQLGDGYFYSESTTDLFGVFISEINFVNPNFDNLEFNMDLKLNIDYFQVTRNIT